MNKAVKICIFNKNTPKETVILSNVDAILDNICTSCKVTENLDGTYGLDAEVIIDDDGLWEYLQEEAILKIKVDYGDEYFRITKPRKTRNRIIIYAIQVTIYETIHLWLNDVRPTGLNGTAAINWILDGAVGVKELEVYSMEKIHNSKINLSEIELILQNLKRMTLNDKKSLKGLQPKRADIITAGVEILHTIMKNLEINEIIVSEYDNLEGLMCQNIKNMS